MVVHASRRLNPNEVCTSSRDLRMRSREAGAGELLLEPRPTLVLFAEI